MSIDILKLADISLFIPGDTARKPVLQDINLTIPAGAHLALLGPNGSGKSTLLRLIHGDLWPATGTIAWLCDSGWETSPIMARTVTGLVSPHLQENAQVHAWPVTVREMLQGAASGAPLSYGSEANLAPEVVEIAKKLEMDDWLGLALPALSQGQLRMVLIARALLAKPRLLLLDEYGDGLDISHKKAIFALLKNIAADVTMIFTSHRADSLPVWLENRLYLHEGRISQQPPQSGRAFPGKLQTRTESATQKKELLLRLNNVSVFIDRVPVLKNINWTLQRGEHWRITGENGSGKSTFLRLLAGDENVAAGGALYRWADGQTLAPLEDTRRRVRLVSDLGQAVYGYPLTALELLCSGFDNSIGLWRQIKPAEMRQAREMLALFFPDNENIATTSIRHLSTGQLRRLYLARALMGKPDILLLDEAANGLDEQARTAWFELLNSLAGGGINNVQPALVVVSHYDEDAPSCINREARMENGALVIVR